MAAPYNLPAYGSTAPTPPGGMSQSEGFPPSQSGGTAPTLPGGISPTKTGGFPPTQSGGIAPNQPGGFPPAQSGGIAPAPPGSFPPNQPGGFPPPQPGGAAAIQPGGFPPTQGGPEGMPPEPSAPKFETIPGYENVGGEEGVPAGPPPPYEPANETMERPVEVFDRNAAITVEEATEALQNYVAEHCCYGKGAAKDMKISNMQSSSAFHYKMESFVESRTTGWHQEPFTGQPIDGPQNGPAPQAWSIQVEQPPKFSPMMNQFEIPHTASIQTCHMCHGFALIRCNPCSGHGSKKCTHCRDGFSSFSSGRDKRCIYCHGRSFVPCRLCQGRGKVNCHICQGNGRLKMYLRLTVTWKIEFGDHVVEKTDLPNELITQAGGVQIFSQELPRVFPLTSFAVEDINVASQRILEGQNALANTSLIHCQRHELRSVPVNEVNVSWKDKSYRFWAYGAEKKVYCPDYPQQCCCGCSIL